MKDDEILFLKIKSPEAINFFEEHNKVISEKGYVDFAKLGRSSLRVDTMPQSGEFFIKESVANGGKLFRVHYIAILEQGVFYPSYYEKPKTSLWFRLDKLEEVPLCILEDYVTRAGGDVSNALRSMSPNFYIKKRI